MKNFNFATFIVFCTLCCISIGCDSGSGREGHSGPSRERETPAEASGRDHTEMKEFARTAFSIGKMEVDLSQIIIEKTNNRGLRQLAQRIKEDHRKANQELEGIVNDYGWDVEKGMAEDKEQKVEELRDAPREEQDHKYLQMMVQSHQKAIKKFEQVLNMGNEQEATTDRRQERLNLEEGEGEDEEQTEREQDTAAVSPQRDVPPSMTEEMTEDDRENEEGHNGNGESHEEGGSHTNLRKHNTYDDRSTGVEQGERDKAKAKYADNVGVPELRRWVRTNLPKLREHLEQSQKMQEQLPRDTP